MKAEHKKRCLNDTFFNSLKSGRLKDLIGIIKKDDSLQLCFRGTYISVYYKGDSLFKIERLAKYDKISFDFNHARYTSNKDKQLCKLEKLGYRYSKGGKEEKKKRRKVTCKYPPHNIKGDFYGFWEESIRIIKPLIDDFLDPKKKHDYFRKKDKKGKGCHLERQRQQNIMRVNNSLNGKYFIYDMEYEQPRNSSDEDKSGRFDMLALRRISEGCYNLVFVELKSTSKACDGKCGIEEHYKSLMKYTKRPDVISTRKSDVLEICRHYNLLGLTKQEKIQVKAVEIIFVFTDGAIEHAGKIKNTKEKCILSSENLKLKYNKSAL